MAKLAYAQDLGSCVPRRAGSTPVIRTKNRQGSIESCRFYLLPIHSSLFHKKPCRFWEVIGNSEEGKSETCIIKMDYQKSENMI